MRAYINYTNYNKDEIKVIDNITIYCDDLKFVITYSKEKGLIVDKIIIEKCKYCDSITPCSAYNFGVPCIYEKERNNKST